MLENYIPQNIWYTAIKLWLHSRSAIVRLLLERYGFFNDWSSNYYDLIHVVTSGSWLFAVIDFKLQYTSHIVLTSVSHWMIVPSAFCQNSILQKTGMHTHIYWHTNWHLFWLFQWYWSRKTKSSNCKCILNVFHNRAFDYYRKKEQTKTHRFEDFMIRIYKMQFQILQTSAETDDTDTVIIQQHWVTSFPPLPLVFVSFRISFHFSPRLGQSPACFVCVTREFCNECQAACSCDSCATGGAARARPLFWGSAMRKVCPGFLRPAEAPAEVLFPDPTPP